MATNFQKNVWDALKKIPKGKVTTYGLIAKYLNTKAVRAVGTAVGKNPNAPTVPCHRVVNSTGQVGNYSGPGGITQKIKFLKKEEINIKDNKIVDFTNKLYKYENR